jgi:predicted membrane channel-forming protein YqfA (hemolysin III family)
MIIMWKIRGKVYDLEPFLDIHPGGRNILESSKGLDNLTELFNRYHKNVDKTKLKEIMNKYEIHSSINDFIYHIIGLIYSLCILTYFIITIIILSEYQDTDTYIWEYVLMGMLCFVPILLIKNIYMIFILEIPLIIWGLAELFNQENYIELKGSRLWDIGLITVIIEIIVCLYVGIKYIFQEQQAPSDIPLSPHLYETEI